MKRLAFLSALSVAAVMGQAFAEVTSAELDAISIPDKVETVDRHARVLRRGADRRHGRHRL